MTVVVAAISAFGVILAAVLPVWLSLRHKVGQIHDQVQNTHKTNMRDDLDRAIRLMESNTETTSLMSRQLGEVKRHVLVHGQDIGLLRDELRGERQERIEEDRQLLAALRQAQAD